MQLWCYAFLVMSIVNRCPFGTCLQSVASWFIALKCATWCWQIVFITCDACIFLTVTPFGVFFICNLTEISCTLWLWHYLLLLTNLKYGLGQNSTKCFNHRGALSGMPCLGCASLKLTSIDSLSYASPLSMFVWYAMFEWDAMLTTLLMLCS